MELNIEWTVPDKETIRINNEQSKSNNTVSCNNNKIMESNINTATNIFQCDNDIYKSIATVTPFMPGFYICTATIMTNHPYYNNTIELSNGTRFTTG